LRDAILAYGDAHNEANRPFPWTKTADEILDELRRSGLRTQQVHGRSGDFAKNHRSRGLARSLLKN